MIRPQSFPFGRPIIAILKLCVWSQDEEKIRRAVEFHADAVEHRGDVFAHDGAVGARAIQFDFFGGREQAARALSDFLEHAFIESALE